MITTTITAEGARYTLVHPRGRREQEALADNIQPDYSLWTSAQKTKHGLDKSSGKRMGYLDEPRVKKATPDRRHYRKPDLAEFDDL